MLHFLIGEAYSGKTTALYHLTRTLTGQGRRVLFFVPEQQTAQTEADLLRLCSNRAGECLEVLNFQRLPNRIFREIGGLCLPGGTQIQKNLLIAQILREHKDDLPLFSRHRKSADFICEISAFLEELMRCGMSAEALHTLSESPHLKNSGNLNEKLKESSLLAAAYDALYREVCSKAPDEAVRLCDELKRRADYNFFRGATVILDGFYDFTAPQYDLIRLMAEQADEVYLASLDQAQDTLLFRRARECRRLLCAHLEHVDYDELSPVDLGLGPRTEPPPEDLVFLCDHIVENPQQTYDKPTEHLSLHRCKTPWDEAVFALREVVRLHEEEQVPFSECAVLYRDPTLYAPLLKELCTQYALPLYTDSRAKLSDSPLFVFFTAATAIACGDLRAEPFLNLLSCGLCPVSDRLAFLYERYIRTWSLSGAALYDEKPYTASIFGLAEMVRPQMVRENEETLALINREKLRLLRPLSRLRAAFDTATVARERVEALLRFAEEYQVDATYSATIDSLREAGDFSAAAENEGLFHSCTEALEALAASEGDVENDFFKELLHLALSFGSVGALPSSPEALAAGDITFTRLKKVRHLFLLGMNTDVFPRTSLSPALLSVRERALISRLGDGSPLFFAKPIDELTREEYFLFYLAASVPRDGLHLVYATQSLDGSNLAPSLFVSRVQTLFSHLPLQDFCADEALPTSPAELYDYLLVQRNESDELMKKIQAQFAHLLPPHLPQSDEEEARQRDFSTPLVDGTTLPINQARLTAYARCPYSYFLRYKLYLATEPEAKLDKVLRGVVLHSVLEHLLYPLSQVRHFKPKLESITDEVLQAEFDLQHRALSEAGYDFTPWDEAWFSDLRHTTGRLMQTLKKELACGEFRPAYFEADLTRTLTPIERTLKRDCRMLINGKADRIDLAVDPETQKTYVRVVDYKSGKHALNSTAIYNGFDTQLLLYLFTLSENGTLGSNREVVPAAAYFLRSHETPNALSYQEHNELNGREENLHFERNGIFLRDEHALQKSLPNGEIEEKSFSPISYKNGVPKANGLLVSEEDMQVLSEAILGYAKDTAEDIIDGKFIREPLWENEESNPSCNYCPYNTVCRYEGQACRIQKPAKDNELIDILSKGGVHRG